MLEIFKAALDCATLNKLVLCCEKDFSKNEIQMLVEHLSGCESLTKLKFVGKKANLKLMQAARKYLQRNREQELGNAIKSAATIELRNVGQTNQELSK